MLCGEDHIIKGTSVYVASAAPKNDRASYGGGGNFGNQGRGGPSGGKFDKRCGGPYSNGPNNWEGPQNNNWNGPSNGGNWGGPNPSGGPNNSGNAMNWNKMGNMNPLAVPMLAALSQASMGLLGSIQQGAPNDGYQGNQGGGNWNQGGGSWDGQGGGRVDRYNR